MAEDPHPPLELDDGALRLAGRIDRIDVGRRAAARRIVYDYKGKTATAQAKWLEKGKLQIALYMLVVAPRARARAGRRPLPAAGARPRRARAARCCDDADPGLRHRRAPTGSTTSELEALLEACAEAARDAVDELRAGALEPRAGALRLRRRLRASRRSAGA